MLYFNDLGRRIPKDNYRVFSESPQTYYKLNKQIVDYSQVLKNSIEFGGVSQAVSLEAFSSACDFLKEKIANLPDFANLLKAPHVPFICKKIESINDLGGDLESVELPNYQASFNNQYPDSHFKAVLQSNSKLPGNIRIDPRSRYQQFLDKCKLGTVVGWYFPQALQEFDVESQRKQMEELPEAEGLCLSGGVDILAALIGTPNLLINEQSYAPILCLSAYVHADPRLVLLMKSYGPHMEFWCMTQMLTKNTTQVSEQWAGGITFYSVI